MSINDLICQNTFV